MYLYNTKRKTSRFTNRFYKTVFYVTIPTQVYGKKTTFNTILSDGGLRHRSSAVENSTTGLLLNCNIVYSPEPNKYDLSDFIRLFKLYFPLANGHLCTSVVHLSTFGSSPEKIQHIFFIISLCKLFIRNTY